MFEYCFYSHFIDILNVLVVELTDKLLKENDQSIFFFIFYSALL